MTINVMIKVHDGVVLAADSAATFWQQAQSGEAIPIRVCNNDDKLFNLVKGLPIGVMYTGTGAIGPASVATRVKDLRRRLSGQSPEHLDWILNPSEYTILDVCERLRMYMFDELYRPVFADWSDPPRLEFTIGGYSARGMHAEEYAVIMDGNGCDPPTQVRKPDECGWRAAGDHEPLVRLLLGRSGDFWSSLVTALPDPPADADDPDADETRKAIGEIRERVWNQVRADGEVYVVEPALPIREAIALADFLAQTAIGWARFRPGAASIGGPIDIAAITRHEGFTWVRRKHYFDAALNPPATPIQQPDLTIEDLIAEDVPSDRVDLRPVRDDGDDDID